MYIYIYIYIHKFKVFATYATSQQGGNWQWLFPPVEIGAPDPRNSANWCF